MKSDLAFSIFSIINNISTLLLDKNCNENFNPINSDTSTNEKHS